VIRFEQNLTLFNYRIADGKNMTNPPESISARKKDAVTFMASENPPFPKEIFLDLTSFCNHKCVFCANPKISNKKTMEEEMVHRVLKEAYDCGTRDLGLYATGESFLVKNLADYIKLAKDIGYEYLFITTNGALATPERVEPVLDAGLDSIKFSISAGVRETYKEIQGKDDFNQVIENLKNVFLYRQKTGLKFRIYVTMVYTNQTKNEVEILKNIVSPYIDEWDPHPLNNQCGNMHQNNEIGEIDPLNPRARGKTNICFQPFKSFTITPEGYVSGCVLDYSMDLILGDLNKTTLKETWTSDLYREFRRRHMAREYKGSICHNCINNTNEPVIPLSPGYERRFT
jgi:radical SAM protein with 4Fe4S-binding SPASM domain